MITGITQVSLRKILSFFNEYHEELDLPTIYRVNAALEKKSGFKPEWYHCCIRSCLAFTGIYAEDEFCPECKEPRYHDKKGRKNEWLPRKKWLYLPIAPRLLSQFRDRERAEILTTYRAKFNSGNDLTDIFSGKIYQKELCGKLRLFSR